MAALIVQVNTRIQNSVLGTIQDDNASYWDPTTGTNLNRANPKSGDLSGFSAAQLANIANAVDLGKLTLVSGSLPAVTHQFKSYGLFSEKGTPGGPGWSGVTGLAAAQPDINDQNRGAGNTSTGPGVAAIDYGPNLVENPTETPGSVF